ncbi:MAG TPA: endo alpha-1,4 polygalactosaminidase, partial [Flavobacterium sp.]
IGCGEKRSLLAEERQNSTTAEKMQELVIGISGYAKKLQPEFIIIPQNGSQLAFVGGKPHTSLHLPYLEAIDAFGIEGLFYNGSYDVDTARVNILRKLKPLKKILVSEYLDDDKKIADAYLKNKNEGFTSFIRTKKNYNYEFIPKLLMEENADDITKMTDVKNYLYLINSRHYKTKADFIGALKATNHDLIIIDLFFNNNQAFTSSEIQMLKKKANGGKRLVVCYLNIGSAENWRYYWKKGWRLHSPDFLEKKYEGYKDEFWVKYWDENWQRIIFGNENSYTRKIITAGFDGAYLDNIEAYHYIYQ